MLTFVYVLNFLDRQLLDPRQADPGSLHDHRRPARADRRALFRDVLLLHRDPGRLARRSHQPRDGAVARLRDLERGDRSPAAWRATIRSSSSARMTVGFGEAGGVPPSYAIITDTFPPGQRAAWRSASSISARRSARRSASRSAHRSPRAFSWRDAFIAIGAVGIVTAVAAAASSCASRARRRDRSRRRRRGLRQGAVLGARCAMFFSNPVLMLAALGSGATQFVTYGLGNFAVLFLMREKGMTLSEVAIWYALVRASIGMGGGMFALGPADRPADAALARRLCARAGDLAGDRDALLRRLRLGADLAAGAGAAHGRDAVQLFLPLGLGGAGAGGSAAQPARAVGRAAAAGDELHRPRARADLGRRGQRLVQGARPSRTRCSSRSTR